MLAGAFSCHHLNAHRSDEYIVPEASDGDVTDTACPGRILLVEQQVSLPLFLIKTETDIQATFTSHQTNQPKAYDWFDTLSERDRLLATFQYWASVWRIRLTLLGVARHQPRFDDTELEGIGPKFQSVRKVGD